MAFSPHSGNPNKSDTALASRLGIPEPDIATVLHAAGQIGTESSIGRTDVVGLFKKSIYKDEMGAKSIPNIPHFSIAVLDEGTGPNLICTSFIPLKLCNHIRLILNMSLRSASDSRSLVEGNMMLLVHRGSLQLRVHSGLVPSLAMKIHVEPRF